MTFRKAGAAREMSDVANIARTLGGKRINGGFLCRCPVGGHGKGNGDRNPSLLVKDGERAPLFKCFVGCAARDVLDALRRRGLWDDRNARSRQPDRDTRSPPVPRSRHW